MRSGAIVAQLSTVKEPSRRCERPCSARAATSLPEPGGPLIITRLPVGATRSMALRSWQIDCELPIMVQSAFARSRSSAFSWRSRAASIARLTVSASLSDLNGFSTKSYAPSLIAFTAVSTVP